MVTMSIIRKEKPKKAGLMSKVKAYITPERKQKAVGVAKQIGRGAGVMGRGLASGLKNVGANIQESGMFSEFEPPKRLEYLPKSTRNKKQRKVKKVKSRMQELHEMGLI